MSRIRNAYERRRLQRRAVPLLPQVVTLTLWTEMLMNEAELMI